jgi:hypothetical protein
MDRGPSGGAVWRPVYHVCEYLSDATKAIAPEPAAQKAWLDAQKDALKTGGLDKALQALARHFEAAEVADDQAPVRRCHRYLIGRRNQLNYREALANDLPIGSGEIESAHRYIAQLRLKRSGAWWPGFAFPSVPKLAPPAPPPVARLCSSAPQLLWQSVTSRVRSSPATAPRLPDTDRRGGEAAQLPVP